jgi:hypothetical protein
VRHLAVQVLRVTLAPVLEERLAVVGRDHDERAREQVLRSSSSNSTPTSRSTQWIDWS